MNTSRHLHGPKPTPLMINKHNSSKIYKKDHNTSHQRHKHAVQGGRAYKSPVIVYLQSPKVVHVLPHDFMTTVQQLTGKPIASSPHQNHS
ncbi:VQ-like protein [Cynara cardunculus var. scolymus]|uniref:VQ-like protein n=1 Tax=Cynara cardunculus var. scolymus TaxID=59895 RepID=A0A118JTY7_CYNCS|nr:VQ-like protein [Cynara cardunculus var. scolymus]